MKLMSKLVGGAVLFVAIAGVSAQSKSEGRIIYLDPKTRKERTVSATIVKESLAGVVARVGTKEIAIPALDVIAIEYPLPSFQDKQKYLRARNDEKKGMYAEAIAIIEKFPRYTNASLNRALKYRICQLHTKIARKDESHVKEAVAVWKAFKKANPDSWQVLHMPEYLTPLYNKQNDVAAVRSLMEEMLALPKLPDEMRLEFTRKTLDLLLQESKYAEAEKKVLVLIKPLKPGDPQRLKLELTLAECRIADGRLDEGEKALRTILGRAKSVDTKAIAYNRLGELYLKMGTEKKDRAALDRAKWNLLYVEMLYNQNKDERARALYHLAKVFAALKDRAKAERFRDTLLNDKDFADSYYQNRARKEMAPKPPASNE